MFAIEGNPHDWRKRIESLGPVKSKQFDQRLVEDIFHFDQNVSGPHGALSTEGGAKVHGYEFCLLFRSVRVLRTVTRPSKTEFEPVCRKIVR